MYFKLLMFRFFGWTSKNCFYNLQAEERANEAEARVTELEKEIGNLEGKMVIKGYKQLP